MNMKTNFEVRRRYSRAFPGGSVVKKPPANAGDTEDLGSNRGQEDPLKEEMATHLPGKTSGQKSLLGYSLWGCKHSDTTEGVSMHTCTDGVQTTAQKETRLQHCLRRDGRNWMYGS